MTEYGTSRGLLILEFFVLCIAFPAVIIIYKLAYLLPFCLWAAAIYCFVIYHFEHHARLKSIWKWGAVNWGNLKPMLIRWLICCVGMFVFMVVFDPDKLFGLLRSNPQVLPIIFIAYPLLSALPQEFIFCNFFFDRYEPFFKTPRAKIIASALVFAFAHMLFINWIAPILSLIAGLIFASTYSKTRSLALVTIEHGLYGNAMFFIGLGWYFWHGSVVVG